MSLYILQFTTYHKNNTLTLHICNAYVIVHKNFNKIIILRFNLMTMLLRACSKIIETKN